MGATPDLLREIFPGKAMLTAADIAKVLGRDSNRAGNANRPFFLLAATRRAFEQTGPPWSIPIGLGFPVCESARAALCARLP
jgi:hypothetical protein